MSYEYVGNDKKFKLWNQMKIIQIKKVPYTSVEIVNEFNEIHRREIEELIDLEWSTSGYFSDEMMKAIHGIIDKLELFTQEKQGKGCQKKLFISLTSDKSVI